MDGTDLAAAAENDDDDDARCDLVVVQESPAERRGFRGSALRRAAERHGVPCVWHPWAVESLLRGIRQDAGEFAARFHHAARKHGVLIRPIGRTLYIMPPYVFDAALAQWLAGQLQATLDTVLAGMDQNDSAGNGTGAPTEIRDAA